MHELTDRTIDEDIAITGYVPGAIGRITELHARYYSQHWGFGLYFESKIASELTEFLNRFNPLHDGLWLASTNGHIIGSIAIDGINANTQGAHLRWFVVAPDFHGLGIGDRLLRNALAFCRDSKFSRVYLWTLAGLDQARHLYDRHGFKLCNETQGTQWGVTTQEQMFELIL